jgi:hypothetical protein
MNLPYSHADPLRTVQQRLEWLNGTLELLSDQLKGDVAKAISLAVADAVRDGLNSLFGRKGCPGPYRRYRDSDSDDRGWHEDEEQEFSRQDRCAEPDEEIPPSQPQEHGRLQQALGLALGTAASWARHQNNRRPLLSTVVVAVTAGVAAYLLGPALAAGAVAVANLLLSAETAGTVTADLAALCG